MSYLGYVSHMNTPTRKATTRTARLVAKQFPPGTIVHGRDAGTDAPNGTIVKHIPMGDAQGGVLIVRWDNGLTGRAQAGSLSIIT